MDRLQNEDSLKATLEELREQEFQDIPAELVSTIVDIQSQDRENTRKAYNQIREEIKKYLPSE